MSTFASSGFAEFDRLSALYRRTLSLLDALLATGDLPDGASDVLATETLPHIEDVEAGFREWLRASEGPLGELRQLVLQGGLGLPEPRDGAEARAALIEAMRARAGAGGDRALLPAPARRIAALAHARLVFAVLPVTPPTDVRFPTGLRTYADIPVPRTPSDLALRIEEIERELWSVAAGHRPRAFDAIYRRVYGFFDAGERLSARAFPSA